MSHRFKLNRVLFPVFAVAVMFMASFSGDALAVDMNSGDLIFVMYGNSTEFIKNLGPSSTLLAPGATTTFSVNSSTLSAVGGSNAVNWALIGYDASGAFILRAGSSKPPSAYTATELNHVSISTSANVAVDWELQSSGDGLSQNLLPASDPNSFTTNFGTDGSLAGGFPVSMQAGFGSILDIISGDYNTNGLMLLGQGMLSSDGSVLTICGPGSCPNSLMPVNITTAPSAAQSFTAVYSEPNGYQYIADANLTISGSGDNGVFHYDPGTNKFSLTGVGGNCSPGQAAMLTDGKLTLNCSSSSVSGSGNTLTVVFNLTPQPVLSGYPYTLKIGVVDLGGESNSKTVGTWTVNRPPGVGAASPMTSSTPVGTLQTFTIVFSDPDGYQNIAAANFYMSGNGGVTNQWLHYLGAPNLFTMLGTNDFCIPGQAKTISNGSLSLNCATSTVTGSGTNLTVVYKVTPLSGMINYTFFNNASDQAGGAATVIGGTWQIP